jgi:hypothetical protein
LDDAVIWLKNFSVLLTSVRSNTNLGLMNSNGAPTKRRFPGNSCVAQGISPSPWLINFVPVQAEVPKLLT